MTLLEALQSSWIKISTAVPQLVLKTLPAIATSCCRRPSFGSCTILFRSAQTLAFLSLPICLLTGCLVQAQQLPSTSSLRSPASAFSTELESREQSGGYQDTT